MKLYTLPPSSYSQKTLIAVIEKNIDVEHIQVNLFNPEEVTKFREVYPIGKIPFLVNDDGHPVAESSFIVEYLDMTYDTGPQLIPSDPVMSRKVRFQDRMLDNYLNSPSGSIFFENMKPEAERNQDNIENWKRLITVSLGFMEENTVSGDYLVGDSFSLADISAAAALQIANMQVNLQDFPNSAAYFEKLKQRPSVSKVFADAEPFYAQIAGG